ncbi:hypothetical protein CLV33_101306 [Jejuia pallidilutea]|uniref:Uncharacterized protein n=1 Tax=Jejuia pallidilutea TaxID=504487 RepID=A0A362X7E7_9FLAO|nr:hypothetical protein [Jejuia pallidilutea]PQV51383.1 hypothetical protein CLV33_101306 [Jejuia pallidilutea]
MKTQKLIVFAGLMLAFFSLSGFKSHLKVNSTFSILEDQEGLIVYATFDGKEDYGYNFITKGKDDEEHTLTFQNVEDDVLKEFNLNSDDLIGTKFKITFNKDTEVTTDEDDMEIEEEINTITKLEKL